MDNSKKNARLEPYIVQSKTKHTHTAILLHGLGSNGEKFGSELLKTGISSDGLNLADSFPGIKFVFPNARRSRSTVFKRATTHQWFDKASLADPMYRRETQADGLSESALYIQSLIKQEMQLVPSQNIILGGMSQGCATSLFTLLSLDFPIGAFVGMCGYLPFAQDLNEVLDANGSTDNGHDEEEEEYVSFGENHDDDDDESTKKDAVVNALEFVREIVYVDDHDAVKVDSAHPCLGTPVFLGHGEMDEKILLRYGQGAAETLTDLGLNVTWKSYAGLGHWYRVPEEIDGVVGFLQCSLNLQTIKRRPES